MATADDLPFEVQIRAQYNNIRHAKRVLEDKTGKDPEFKSTILPYRDRWIIKSSKELTRDDLDTINKPREDAVGGRLATPPPSSARARRRSAERSRLASAAPDTTDASEGRTQGGAGPSNEGDPSDGEIKRLSLTQKRSSWRTAVAKAAAAAGLRKTGKTAFQRLGVVRWDRMLLRGVRLLGKEIGC